MPGRTRLTSSPVEVRARPVEVRDRASSTEQLSTESAALPLLVLDLNDTDKLAALMFAWASIGNPQATPRGEAAFLV